jgi:hypothetical protein
MGAEQFLSNAVLIDSQRGQPIECEAIFVRRGTHPEKLRDIADLNAAYHAHVA